eukprot:6491612-Amphidinium_carterae.1
MAYSSLAGALCQPSDAGRHPYTTWAVSPIKLTMLQPARRANASRGWKHAPSTYTCPSMRSNPPIRTSCGW